MIRTTVRLDESLFKNARKQAIDQSQTFGQIVNEALALYLFGKKKIPAKKNTPNKFLSKLAAYKLRAPRDLASKHDKYAWE